MGQRDSDLVSVLIYGEYFGGYYPGHPAEPGLKKEQPGIAYSPGHHFYAFDVCFYGSVFLDFDDARALLLAAGFPLVAAPLWRGTVKELLAIDVETFETTIPSQLGHPPLEKWRIAEGIVIRPIKEVRFGTHRAILKKKAIAFWEATNQPGMAVKAAKEKGALSGFEPILDLARSLANENRLRAVVSKDPDLLKEYNVTKLIGLFGKDIMEDLQKQHGEKLAALGTE